MVFGKFSCGCKGILSICGTRVILLQRCTSDDGELEFRFLIRDEDLDLKDRKFDMLPIEECAELIRQVGDLISFGYLYLDMRRILNVPIREQDDPRLF